MTWQEVVGERIKGLRVAASLSQEQLGKVLGIGKAAVSSFEKGKNFPSMENIQKIADYFKLEVKDILTLDTGVVYDLPPDGKIPNGPANRPNHDTLEKETNIVFVPPAQAGYLSSYSQDQINELPRLSLDVLNLGPGKHAAFQVRGDSMSPLLKPGDFFIGRTIERKDRLELGEVYAIETRDEGIVIKRIVDENENSLYLASDNRTTRPYELRKDEVIRLHKYACHIGFGSARLAEMTDLMNEVRDALKAITTKE